MRYRLTLLVALTAALAAGRASAISNITNTATVNYNNDANVAQTPQAGSTTYAAEDNPVLAVRKTRDIGSGAPGTLVTFRVRVSYPKIVDATNACEDDSEARAVTMTDPIPAGFTYQAGSTRASTNDGSTFGPFGTDASDGVDASGFDVSFNGGTSTLTVVLGTMKEGTGDVSSGCPQAGNARVVEFKATKN